MTQEEKRDLAMNTEYIERQENAWRDNLTRGDCKHVRVSHKHSDSLCDAWLVPTPLPLTLFFFPDR